MMTIIGSELENHTLVTVPNGTPILTVDTPLHSLVNITVTPLWKNQVSTKSSSDTFTCSAIGDVFQYSCCSLYGTESGKIAIFDRNKVHT